MMVKPDKKWLVYNTYEFNDKDANLMNPWLTIWIKPGQTVRYLQDSPSNRLVSWILICISGIDYSLNQFLNKNAGDSNSLSYIIIIIIISLIGGPISGIIL